MGWSIRFTASKNIHEDDVEQIVNNLPPKFRSCIPEIVVRQSWGWSAGVDIWKPENSTIKFSGTYGISGDIAEEFEQYFASELALLGYEIRIKRSW